MEAKTIAAKSCVFSQPSLSVIDFRLLGCKRSGVQISAARPANLTIFRRLTVSPDHRCLYSTQDAGPNQVHRPVSGLLSRGSVWTRHCASRKSRTAYEYGSCGSFVGSRQHSHSERSSRHSWCPSIAERPSNSRSSPSAPPDDASQRPLAHLQHQFARRNRPMILRAPQQLRRPACAASRPGRQVRLARHQEPATVVLKRFLPVPMSRGFGQALQICREALLLRAWPRMSGSHVTIRPQILFL